MHYRGSTVLNLVSGLGCVWEYESSVNSISMILCDFEWNFAYFNVISCEITKIMEIGFKQEITTYYQSKMWFWEMPKINFQGEFTNPSQLISNVGELWNSDFFIVQKVNCKWYKWIVIMLVFEYFLKYESFWHHYQNMTNSTTF